MTAPAPRIATFDEYKAVAGQWADLTDDTSVSPGEMQQRLEWWLGPNPSGDGVLAVVEEGGRYLSVAGWCPKTLMVQGSAVPVAEIGHTMTAPEARGRGYFSALVRFLGTEAATRGIRALYGTPNAASGAPYVGKLGFVGLWRWRRWIRPLQGATSVASAGVAALASVSSRHRSARITVCDDVERLTGCIAPGAEGGTPSVRRDPQYLAWRYPTDQYRLLVAEDPTGTVLGWVAVGSTMRLGKRAVSIADLGVAEGKGSILPPLVRAALESSPAGEAPANAFAMSHPSSPLSRVLLSNGFAWRQSEWEFIARELDGNGGEADLFGQLAFLAGDSDTV